MNRNAFSKDSLYLYIARDLTFKSLAEENSFFKNKRNMYCNFFYYEESLIRLPRGKKLGIEWLKCLV